MKKLFILFLCLIVNTIFAQTAVDRNVRRNTDGNSVAWKVSRTNNVDTPHVIVDGTVTSSSGNTVSAPGATPSPSPVQASNVQTVGGAKVDTAIRQYTGVPSTFTVGTTDATVFTLAAGEVGFIQNLDDAALAVKKGASASTSSFSFILAKGTAADDGTGGAIEIKDWVGVVSVAAMTGSPRYIAWKQAP